MSIFCWN